MENSFPVSVYLEILQHYTVTMQRVPQYISERGAGFKILLADLAEYISEQKKW